MTYARAYGRALSALRDLHREEFDELLADHLEGVRNEDAEARALPAPAMRLPTVGEVLNAPATVARREAADARLAVAAARLAEP